MFVNIYFLFSFDLVNFQELSAFLTATIIIFALLYNAAGFRFFKQPLEFVNTIREEI